RFLDRMVLAVDPTHGRRAADYERAMRSRNRLLADNRLDDSWLSGIEAQMAELGIAMALARSELVGMLAGMIARTGAGSPFPSAGLELTSGYDGLDLARPSADIEDEARMRLRSARYGDRAAGRTLEGAHRAELSVTHLAKAMPAALSSTGEQKALLIGLVLAHARLVAAMSSLPPLLLLDEIAAHLDPGRRAALFDLIAELGVQAFMTGTDASLFAALGDRAQIMEVSGGTVRPADPARIEGASPETSP
ncbi:MAG: DNA replication and repair protein RecF, partial [Aurantimonas coralicida]